MPATYTTINEYISGFPDETQTKLKQLYETIRVIVPGAEETINYAIPTFKLNGKNLVHFAGYKNHIGFYPTPNGIEAFEDELSKYKRAKGSVQFPLDEPLPLDLIKRIVIYLLEKMKEKKA